MKNLKASLALGLGYWLVYAGIHNGGEFALAPWQAFSTPTAAVTTA